MDPLLQEQVTFHLTGNRPGAGLDRLDGLNLRPALLAGYRDLTRLRYDFPLVLVRGSPDDAFVRSLSGLIDTVLKEIAPPGIDGERLRKHVLQLEREIRTLVAEGATGSLSELWIMAAGRLASHNDELLRENLSRARAALKVDGEVIDCNVAMPARLLTHAWQTIQEKQARRFRNEINRLILKLSDILRADFIRSETGRSAASLKAAVGAVHAETFDFDVMSHLLARAAARNPMPESRCRRIRSVLSVLKSQRFFPADQAHGTGGAGAQPYGFVFDSCNGALEAFRERVPEMVGLVKAIAVAELEIDGRYVESKHDRFFEAFDDTALGPKDLALFPDYLVCLSAGPAKAGNHARLMELLASSLPVKVLVQTDDVVEESTLTNGHFAFGVRSVQLATMATGLNEVYLLQSSSSNLYPLRERILTGLAYPGPALFSVFSGPPKESSALSSYLVTAAAMQSRAFPAFTYDPTAGPDWASRFRLENNPQPEVDWPVQNFSYEDSEHQRISEDLAFTFIDFVVCDARYARHFARVPHATHNGSMIPVGKYLAGEMPSLPEQIPCLLMVDGNDVLQKVIVDGKLIQEMRRCGEMWHKLQELGGIHNSHAEQLLAREKIAWEEQKQREIEALSGQATPAVKALAAEPAPATPGHAPAQTPAAQEEKRSDEPYIETPRCTTCDECTQINNRMFAYDANKQAYIADLSAGTYRQLVEAAESCQVSIIHPGKPRNPNEPGLDELIKRAASFL